MTAGASASTPCGVTARGLDPSAFIAQIRKPPSCPRIGLVGGPTISRGRAE
jgi:hypothetical protein